MMNNPPLKSIDLDGFPILRLDQIPSIETTVLERAQIEVAELIQKMNTEKDKSQKSLVYYLNKQLDEMEKEITKRIAEARVLALLNGNEEEASLHQFKSRQPVRTAPISPRSNRATTMAANTDMEKTNEQLPPTPVKEKPKFEPIPLPSELRKLQSVPSSASAPQSSRSEQDIELKYSRSQDTSHPKSEEEIEPVKRPKSGQPSRRSVAVIEENFGSSFIVGAIEKRRRFLPKKVPKETESEVREKNRESRSRSLTRLILGLTN
jgi:hypothetical protein